jgi:hypothetical protein
MTSASISLEALVFFGIAILIVGARFGMSPPRDGGIR